MADRKRLRVFYTVDTELWPMTPDWLSSGLQQEMAYYFHGRTTDGDFGVEYQMDVLDSHGLKGVFFVEGLFAEFAGLGPLKRIVEPIRKRGHDVQLHLHSEWLKFSGKRNFIDKIGQYMWEFTLSEQVELLQRATKHLKAAAGGVAPIAFRAGNYGVNLETLRALDACGIGFDSSFNLAYHLSPRRFSRHLPLLAPEHINGVLELPVTFFEDRRGHFRHLQLTACSFEELQSVLLYAWQHRYPAVVIVSHSFELMKRIYEPVASGAQADTVVVRRFHNLCRFLKTNADKFETMTFPELKKQTLPAANGLLPFRSNAGMTLRRMFSQARRRIPV